MRDGERRKAGGHPGHRGAGRELAPEDQVDEIVEHYPEACRGCGREFTEDQRRPSGRFGRHQVAELPPIAVVVTEHRLHRLCCPDCGAETRAELPAGVPRGAFGPRLEAAVATLSVRNRISRRDLSELCEELFGCPVSTGTVDAICQRVSAALAGPHAELHAAVKQAPVVNADETGWKQAGKRRWLWGGVTPQLAAFLLTQSRGQDSARKLLGDEFAGVCVSDRWSGYNHLPLEQRALCWSHLTRDFRKLEERGGLASELGAQALDICERLFTAWHAHRSDNGDRVLLQARIEPLRDELRVLTERCQQDGDPKTRRFCSNLLKLWPALWTFAHHDHVEPTNNAAERGLRGAVIYRKLSFGNQSDPGARFLERMLSISHTCRLQHRSLFGYLTAALNANAQGEPTPSLIPP
jgi:transposase